MAEPLITPADISTAFNLPPYEDGSPELKQLQFFIRFASSKARRAVREVSLVGIDEGLADTTLDRDLLIGTMAIVVKRALDAWRRDPSVRSRAFLEETTEYNDVSPSSMSLVYFTDAEIADLVPHRAHSSGGEAFTATFGPAL